jgi:DNA-binding NarL/FixJ family response regulator
MNRIKVLIADDHELIRQGVRSILHSERRAQIVGEAVTGRQAVELAEKLGPDVVIMDLVMPELDGIEAIRQIRAADPSIRIIVLTMHNSEILVRRVLSAGASAYVLKSELADKLKKALHAVSRGDRYLSDEMLERFTNRYLQQTAPEDESARFLTGRELEVAQLLSLGKSSKEIAEILKITARTVDTHRANIMRKMNVHSVTELLYQAFTNKLIEVGSVEDLSVKPQF